MATLYISEYSVVGSNPNGALAMPQEPAIASQTVTIGSGSASSNPFNVATQFLRLTTDATCSVSIGPAGSVTAAATSSRMAANQTEYRSVPRGAGFAVAVITNS